MTPDEVRAIVREEIDTFVGEVGDFFTDLLDLMRGDHR